MDEAAVWAIGVVGLLVLAAGAWTFMTGPNSPFAAKWREEARELEVVIRMSHGTEMVDNLHRIARLYFKLGQRWDAEKSLQRALQICRRESGEMSPALIPLLDEYIRLMKSTHRKKEALTLEKEIERINAGNGAKSA